jgi:hypothetical protein
MSINVAPVMAASEVAEKAAALSVTWRRRRFLSPVDFAMTPSAMAAVLE